MPSFIHILQHFLEEDYGRTCWEGKNKRHKYYQSAVSDAIDALAGEEQELEA